MAEKSRKLKRIQTVALTLLVIAGLVNYIDRGALSIANHSISVEMKLSATQMGVLLAAFSLPYAFAQLPIGVLLDKIGARVVLGLGMLVWSLAQFSGGFVRSLQQFIVARMILGVGEAPQFPAGAKVFSEWFALKERGGPTGVFVASSTLAPAIAPPLLTGMMLAFGWRGMFGIMGALGVAAAIGWILLYRDRRNVKLEASEVQYLSGDEPASASEQSVSWSDYKTLLASPTTWGLIFGWMGVIYMVFFYLTWLPAYLEHERHLTIAKVGWVVSIPYIAGTFGQLSSGYSADFLLARGLAPITSRKWPICIGLVGAALFTVPAAFTPSLNLAVLCISLAMYFVNLASGASWALVSVAAPRRFVASLGSLKNFGGYFGGSFAPVITGIIVDQTHSFVNALLISAVISIIGALFYLFVVRKPIEDPHGTQAGPSKGDATEAEALSG
jgi:sugar phosphate permease